MDHDQLMALFRRLTLAGAPMLAAGCGVLGTGGQCPPEQDTTTTVSVASLQQDAAVIDAGSADGGLEDLCNRALLPDYARIVSCKLVTADGGLAVQVVHTPYCVGGRRPVGLAPCEIWGDPGPLGAWLANTAYLEAASVDAFEIMSAELAAQGAPRALVRAALAAADDERRHARVMAGLAQRAGARPAEVRIARGVPRDLETIAAENAVEGCVRETFAALVACRQARAAEEVTIRRAMLSIGVDETRHAALAWAVNAWAEGVLPPAARRRTRALRRQAVEDLRREIAVDEPAGLRVSAGLPDGPEAVRLASELFARLA